jgi:hypothetical protein
MKLFVIGGATTDRLDSPAGRDQTAVLNDSMERMGRAIGDAGHDLLVCSPFAGSADAAVARGAARTASSAHGSIEFHFPDAPAVRAEFEVLERALGQRKIVRLPYPLVPGANERDMRNSWLLAQMAAMERSHAVIALGGKAAGAASLLLAVAESRQKLVLPLAFLDGAAGEYFARRRYSLADVLRDDIGSLSDPKRVEDCVALVERLAAGAPSAVKKAPSFFLSYARARPSEADFVEITLRRRGFDVFRDIQDFGPGEHLQSEIDDHLRRCDVFVALWSTEYACSPFCFDELTSAAKRKRDHDTPEIWLFCVDATRVVPPEARELISYPSQTRESLEGNLLRLVSARFGERKAATL